jgi:short-subunit dehydrogenase
MTNERAWAIITGASSGIGRALAFQFAAGGFNLFLTARNEPALGAVAAQCSSKHGIQTEVIAADLSRKESVDNVITALTSKPRHYEILVNNAGFGIHGDFASSDIDLNVELVNVQVTNMLRLTRTVLPGMIARRRGRILNVASVYSFSPVPFQSVYGACKAFLLSFSSSLQNELQGTGVTVTVYCPGVTQTEFRERAGIGQRRQSAGMTAEEAAQIAYIETLRGKHIVVPGFLNRLYVFVAQHLPPSTVPSIVRFINRQRGQAN